MGLRNLRAICPNCGAKIHTQPKGLGHITWANSWINARTGNQCPFCGVALTGKVKSDNRAELAPVVAPATKQQHVVIDDDGNAKVFATWTEAATYRAVHGGQLTSV